MNIESYTTFTMYFYAGLFLLFTFIGIVWIIVGIRKKTFRYWWIVPCSMFYAVFALFSTCIAYMAYDDPSDPNYRIYEGWNLQNFIFNDIKMFVIWLLAIGLLFLFYKKKSQQKSVKTKSIAFFIFLMILIIVIILLTFIRL